MVRGSGRRVEAVCIVGDSLVGFEDGGEREKVGVLFLWEAGYVWWLFGGLGGGP